MTLGFDYKKFSILFVDDEERTRKYFRMAFEQDFNILTAGDIEQAWDLLASANPRVGVLLTDQRMPQHPGTELLSRARSEHPDIVRVLTTAYADIDAIVEAVNTGAIYRYVVKPWDVRELRVTLMRAMEYFVLYRERNMLLEEKLSSLQQLLVADRLRTFAVLAEGLSTRVRDTMIALQAYVDLAREQFGVHCPEAGARGAQSFLDLRAEVEDAHRHMLKVVRSVAETTIDRCYDFADRVGVRGLLESARMAAGYASTAFLDVAPDLPELSCSRSMLERMFAILMRHVMRGAGSPSPADGPALGVTARDKTTVWGADGVLIDIVQAGFAWSADMVASLFMPAAALSEDAEDSELLAAFFIAYHHGGAISLRRGDEDAAGFRVLLPFSPEAVTRPALDADAAAELFLTLPWWDALERGRE
jgi:two-component system, probable response regulator PhcQ